MLNIGNNRECFFDNYLIDEEKTTAPMRLHKPVRRGVLIEMDMPWEGHTHMHSVVWAEGKWRFYYIGRHNERKNRSLCYMESEDALHWTRPDFGIVEFEGNKHNNIILNNEMLDQFGFCDGFDNFSVFYDESPCCKPDEKYKMVGWWFGHVALVCLKSADGIHFTKCDLITEDGGFDSQNRAFWSEGHGKYFCYYRCEHEPGENVDLIDKSYTTKVAQALYDPEKFALREPGDGTYTFMRDVQVIESKDFTNWSIRKRIVFSGKDFQIYNNCVFPYPRAPQMLIAFPLRYVERKAWTKNYDELCGREARLKRVAVMARYGMAVTDSLFMSSRDGCNFTKFDEAFLPPPPENPGSFVYGDGAAVPTVMEVPSEIPGADNEYMIMVRENFRCVEGNNQMVKYTIRMDGFVSRYSANEPTRLVTKEFIYDGKSLFANIATSARGGAYFTLKCGEQSYTSCEVFGNATHKRIHFEDDAVAHLSGKPVTLEVEMYDCDLYAIKFE